MKYVLSRQGTDPRVDITARSRAVEMLRRTPPFDRVSRRFLNDLTDMALLGRLPEGEDSGFFERFGVLVVLNGTIELSPRIPQPFPPESFTLQPGVYLGRDPRWKLHAQLERRFNVKALSKDGIEVLLVDAREMGRWLRFSPALRQSVGFPFGHRDLIGDSDLKPPGTDARYDINTEFIWMAQAPHVKFPTEALTYILGAIVARMLKPTPPTALLIGGTRDFWVWETDKFQVRVNGLDVPPLTTNGVIDRLKVENPITSINRRRYVFCANPADPNTLPPRYQHLKFHRIVYLTDSAPAAMPIELADLLHEDVAGAESHKDDPPFTSFVPTVFVPKRSSFGKYAASLVTQCFTYCLGIEDFRAAPLEPKVQILPVQPEKKSKAQRDMCRLNLDVRPVEDQWAQWHALFTANANTVASFIDYLVPNLETVMNTLQTWLGAVTNKNLGVALSGGGACAYRFGPIREEMKRVKLPINVIGGLSGGALIGAYCAVDPVDGFKLAKDRGKFFWLTLPVVMWSTLPLELKVNIDLNGARVEDLETRFLAVTTKLPELDTPEACYVERGTVGAAVRASGTLPPPFAPTIKNGVRYCDGAAATMIPAHLLSDNGADLVLAVNVIPGPKRTNPYVDLPFGLGLISRLFYNFTPFGRYVDAWAWHSFELQRTSAKCGEEADVFLEFAPEELTLLEAVEFHKPDEIEDRVRTDLNRKKIHDAVDELKRKWDAIP